MDLKCITLGKVSQSQKEKILMLLHENKIKLKVYMYVYLNKFTRRHVVKCGQENKEGCVIGSEEGLNTGDACELQRI